MHECRLRLPQPLRESFIGLLLLLAVLMLLQLLLCPSHIPLQKNLLRLR